MPALRTVATNQRGRPRSRFFEIAHRIADRMQPEVARAFTAAVRKLQEQVDLAQLRSAISGGSIEAISAAALAGHLGGILEQGNELEMAMRRTATLTGRAGADVLSDVTGFDTQFNARHPNVVLFAREEAGRLIVQVSDDVKEAVRIVLAAGQDMGLTTVQQARAIREVVGLPPNWSQAPLNLANEIREGRAAAATRRRLSAVDKARIRSKIARGEVTEEFVDEMQEKYSRSLLNRRGLNIARTETQRAANFGQREEWRQASDEGVIPKTARRHPIVTPDERLRETHAAVPGMNPDGVGLDEPFETPWGPLMGPPWEADPYLCRCGEGLSFVGVDGVL